jgi:rRNA-processing protein FCF1
MDETLGTDQQLISRLAAGGVQVVHTAGSKSQQLVGTSAVVCYMKTRNGTFEAAFLTDVSAAEQLRVCETQSASRHPYSISGRTMDAAYPVYWSRSGNVVLWTKDQDLDRSLRTVLRPVSVPC